MATYIFKFGQDEFITQASSKQFAAYQADAFVEKHQPMDEPYGWVQDSEGPFIFHMTVGA